MTDNNTNEPGTSDVAAVRRLGEARDQIIAELRKTIVGMEEVIDESLTAIFARGHVLLEGVPGLAKTLLVSSLSKCLSLSFHRIQFTPDLMPSHPLTPRSSSRPMTSRSRPTRKSNLLSSMGKAMVELQKK